MWIWSTNILSSISIVKLFGLPFRLSNFLLGFFVFQYRYMIFATWSGLCVCVYVCGVLENAQHTLTQVKRKINFHCYWCHSNDQYSRSNSNKHFSSFSFPSQPNVSVCIVVLRRCCWYCPHPPNHTLICDSICITQLNKYTTNIRIHTHTHTCSSRSQCQLWIRWKLFVAISEQQQRAKYRCCCDLNYEWVFPLLTHSLTLSFCPHLSLGRLWLTYFDTKIPQPTSCNCVCVCLLTIPCIHWAVRTKH